jgi:hypothetical protein
MLWLDFLIFGNGKGMKSPCCDDVFYWLNGRLYTWIGGFGAQLRSFEWFAPKAGTRRRLAGRDFVVFSVSRSWIRVDVTWAVCQDNPITIEELRDLRRSLGKLA